MEGLGEVVVVRVLLVVRVIAPGGRWQLLVVPLWSLTCMAATSPLSLAAARSSSFPHWGVVEPYLKSLTPFE